MRGWATSVLFPILFWGIFLSSCSLFTSLSPRPTIEDLDAKGDKVQVETVSKVEYDKLLLKYETILKRNRDIEGSSENQASPEMSPRPSEGIPAESIDLLSNLKETKRPETLSETVEVFSEQGTTPPLKQATAVSLVSPEKRPKGELASEEIEVQIAQLQKAMNLVGQNKFEDALQLLKSLEGSSNNQVAVRTKFWTGEIFFKQGEYDLSMQVYEEVISQHAFSSIVLKALGRLIVCVEKLKLQKKYDLYYSLLHDFFETV